MIFSITKRVLWAGLALIMLITGAVPSIAHGQAAGVRTQCGSSAEDNTLTTEDQNRICQNTEEYDDTPPCAPNASTGDTSGGFVSTNDNQGDAFRFFIRKGLGAVQAAAIVGNLMGESHVNPAAQEDRSKDVYPKNVYPTIQNSRADGKPIGFGIAQWTWAGRQMPLVEMARARHGNLAINDPNLKLTDLGLQLDYLWAELNGIPPAHKQPGLAEIKATENVDQATQIFMEKFERPASNNHPERQRFAREALQKYGGETVAPSPDSPASPVTSAACPSEVTNVGAVNCDGGTPIGDESLSQVRKNVVCLAQQEQELWTSGKLQRGTGYFKYSQNNEQDWCADFASWVYWQAGYSLRPEPAWRVAAVQGIWDIGKQGGKFQYHAKDGYTPRPGDMIIHKTNASHVNIVVAVNGSNMTITGGNQGGNDNASGPFYSTSRVTTYTEPINTTKDNITGYVTPD